MHPKFLSFGVDVFDVFKGSDLSSEGSESILLCFGRDGADCFSMTPDSHFVSLCLCELDVSLPGGHNTCTTSCFLRVSEWCSPLIGVLHQKLPNMQYA